METSIVLKLINETKAGLNQVQNDLAGVNTSAKSVEKSFNSAKQALGAFVALFAGNEVLNFVNTIQTLDNRLKLVTNSSADLNAQYRELFKVAQETRAPLSETINLYSRLAQNQDVVGVSGRQLTDVVKAFNLSLAISGTSGGEAASAILQFSQAMQSGKLQGDEFRAMAEANPKFLKILSETTGIAREELKKLGSEGFLKSTVLAQALIDALPQLQAEMANTSTTVGQAITQMSNEFQRLGRDFLESSGASELMVTAIKHITDNAENLIPILKVVGVALLALGAYFAPIAAAVFAATAAVVAFADVLGPLLKPVVDAAENALGGLIKTLVGFGASVKALLKLENPFEAFDKATKEYDATAKKTTKSTSDLEKETKNLGDTTKTGTKVSAEMNKKMQESGLTARLAKNEYTDFIEELKQNIVTSRLDSKEKEIQQTVYKALAAEIKRFGGDASKVSETRRKEIEAEVRSIVGLAQAEAAVTEQRKKLIDDLKAKQIEGMTEAERIRNQTQEFNKKYRDLETALETAYLNGSIKSYQEYVTRLKQLNDQKNADMKLADEIFRTDAQTRIRNFQNQVLTEEEKYQQGLKAINDRYNAANMSGTELHQQEILAYKRAMGQKWYDQSRQFQDQELTSYQKYAKDMMELERAKQEGLIQDQQVYDANRRRIEKEYRDATIQEYSNLYGLLSEKLQSMTGVSQKEFGVIRDTVKLVFGVDIDTIIKEGFAAMIRYVLGFRTAATGDLNGIGGIMNSIFSSGGTGVSSVGGFATTAMEIFKGFGTGAMSIFGALGDGIISAFSGIGSVLGNVFSGLGGFLKTNVLDLLGSIGSKALDAISYVGRLIGISGGSSGGSSGGGLTQGLVSAGLDYVTGGLASLVSNIPVVGQVVSGVTNFISSGIKSIGKIFGFSDPRLKTNISPLGDLGGLGVYSYNYKSGYGLGGGQQVGFMSDEVQKVFPNAVKSSGGFDTVDYGQVMQNLAGRSSQPMMICGGGGGDNVQISFTINAVDSRGIQEVLIENKQLITNIVANAVRQKGRSFA
jgi:tape measure domain-containing protein